MVTRIEADVLIPGRGEPIGHGVVIVDGARIAYAGSSEGAPSTASADVVRAAAVLPGLWDCHTHAMGLIPAGGVFEQLMSTPIQVLTGRAVKDIEAALDAGFTSVREVGGIGLHLARVVEEGIVVGPAIYGAGSMLSMTGGHGDAHGFPVGWVHEACARAGAAGRLCDGVPECLKAVREQLRAGARVIKICASGGVMSEVDHPIHQQFSGDELRAIVEEAGRAERVVAAHCHGKPGILAALEAGVRTIEHGTYLDEEAASAMRELGAILVPTRFIVERLRAGSHEGLPEYAMRKLLALADRHSEAIHVARESGVRMALGTDISTSSRRPGGVPWGSHGQEFVHLVEHGFSNLEAIEAATATAPETLGPQGPRSGLLAEGYDADVIAVDGNPTLDVAVLGDPARVTHVWKAGALVKSPTALDL